MRVAKVHESRAEDRLAPFRIFGPLQKVEVREFTYRRETIDELLKAFLGFQVSSDDLEFFIRSGVREATLAMAEKAIAGMKYSAIDVEDFIIRVGRFENMENFPARVGLFLSALINKGTEKEYVLRLDSLKQRPFGLCINNSKDVVVYGDVGAFFAAEMKSGSITVYGNAESVGWMAEGGEIYINGSVFNESFAGGKTWGVSFAKFDDEIHTSRSGAKIYVNGELVNQPYEWSK